MQRNWILFVVLSVIVMGGWLWLDESLWRTAQKSTKKDEQAAPAKKNLLTVREETIARCGGLLFADPGPTGAFALGPWLLAVDQLSKYIPPPARWAQIPEAWRPALFLLPHSLPEGLLSLQQMLPAETRTPALPVVQRTLGGDGYHLEAELTALGGGVRSVTLTRFRAANYLGRPMEHKLALVPEDAIQPAYLMHHYADPKADNPVFGLGEQTWQAGEVKAGDGGAQEVSFSTQVPGLPHLKIVKTYRLGPKDYHLGLLIEIHDERDRSAEGTSAFRYQLAGALGLPIEGEWYTSTFRNAFTLMVERNGSRWRESYDSPSISIHAGAPRVPGANRGDSMLQYAATANQYFAAAIVVDDKQPPREAGGGDPKDVLAWARATHETAERRGYFIKTAGDRLEFEDIEPAKRLKTRRTYKMLPRVQQHLENELKLEEGNPAVINFYESPRDGEPIAAWVRRGHVEKPQFDDITNRVTSEVVELKPGRKVAHQFLLYHGPIKVALLGTFTGDAAVPPELVERYTDRLHLNTLTDYPSNRFSQWIHFSDLVIFFTRLMHWLLDKLHYVVGYGLSIILLTVIVRGAMFPISRRQAMFSVKMQALAPEFKKLGEKYKNDPLARQQATMDLYRKHDLHPLGSCLPMVMQLPVFLGLYFALQESIHFRLAPFLWIRNLAAPDMLIWWSENIPVISDPVDPAGGLISGFLSMFYLGPYFNLLPVFAVVLMVIQQQLMTPPPTDEQQAAQQKMMKWMMIVFGVMFYKVAAGLCIYFIASSLWGLAERKLLPRKKPGELPPPTASMASLPKSKPGPAGPRGRGRGPVKKDEETAMDRVKAWWSEVLEQARKK